MSRFGRTFPIRAIVSAPLPPTYSDIYDAATVYLALQPSGVDVEDYIETGTIYLDIAPSAPVESHGMVESATIYLDLQALGGECYSTASAQNFGEGDATLRWSSSSTLRWSGTDYLRWSALVTVGDALAC